MPAPEQLTTFSRHRFSPVHFDGEHTLAEQQVDLLLEAARLAPSAGNSQPWAFVVGRRGDEIHRRISRHLARSSARWAPTASLLLANLAQRHVEGSALEYSEFSRYDLGQAIAHLTVQADAMGLGVHQFRSFDRDALAREFAVPEHWEVTSMAAVGRAVGPAATHAGTGTSRERRSREQVTWAREDRDGSDCGAPSAPVVSSGASGPAPACPR